MDIYQHFRQNEHSFVDQVLSWKDNMERSYQPKLTDFLDPREQQIIEMIIGKNQDLIPYKNGGNIHTERKRVIIAPLYEPVEEDDFNLTMLQAAYMDKFVAVGHRDVMGAFLNLGIKRQKLGDIYAGNGIVQIVVCNDIVPYITANLTRIKQAAVKFEEKDLQSLQIENKNWQESEHTVSSLRLDLLIKEIYRVSRKDAAALVAKKLVKVNYKLTEDTKIILQEGDMISIRGQGRSKLVKINGFTKKNKYKIVSAVLK